MVNEQIHHGNQFKKILKHGSWYFLSSLLTRASLFLLIPVYTRYLSPTEFGILGNFEAVTRLLPFLISLYLNAAFSRYYYLEREVSEEQAKRLYSTHFWFVCLWGSVVIIVGLVVSTFTLVPLVEVPFFPYIPLVFAPSLLNQLAIMGSLVFRANLKAREISVLNLVGFAASTSLTLVLLVPCKMGVLARLYGAALGPLINFVVFTVIAVRSSLLEFVFDVTMLRRGLLYSLPMIPNVAGGWINRISDRLILTYYGKLSEVGLYSLSAQIAYILYLINDATTQVQGPISMSALTEDTQAGKEQISEFLSFYICLILFFYLGLTFFSKEVLHFLTDERFHSAYQIVGLLAFPYVLSGVNRVFTTIIAFHGKTWVISSGAILSALGNIVLNFTFIPYFGQVAAAWASMLSRATNAIWVIYWAQKTDPVPINFGIVGPSFSVAFILVVVQQVVQANQWLGFWQMAAFKILLILFYWLPFLVLPSFQAVRHKLLGRLHTVIRNARLT